MKIDQADVTISKGDKLYIAYQINNVSPLKRRRVTTPNTPKKTLVHVSFFRINSFA